MDSKIERQQMAEILIDAPAWSPTPITAGAWKVADLKAKGGVPAHKVLSRVDPFGLTALNDEQVIEVQDGMRFISHVRPGGSS